MDNRPTAEVGWQKKYRWVRTCPELRDHLGNVPEDYCAYDGDEYAGRIYQDHQTLKKGQWRWNGSYPRGCREVLMPNTGWLPTVEDAARQVEDYWDRMKAAISTRSDHSASRTRPRQDMPEQMSRLR